MGKKQYLCAIICAYMKLLLVLLAVMTWTVESKNSVSLSDDSTVPYDIEVGYANTYNKGQVRANDTATLVLSHMEGITINGIEVYVKSNKTGGAGTFTIAANGQTVATKTGSFEEWFGAYDNASYHALSFINRPINNVHMLTISLVGIANSLHIEKYVITYAPRPAYTVTLMAGNRVYDTMTEEAGMQGVVLPSLPDTANWQFIGWSETEIWSSYEAPTLHHSNNKFYPEADCTLWATYQWNSTPEQVYMTVPESANYMYINTLAEVAITGVPSEGELLIQPMNPENENQWYAVTFNAAGDSATIQHLLTGEYVGYERDQLAATQSVWSVYHNEEQTVLYMTYNAQKYVLFPNILANALYKTENIASAPTALMTQIALPCCEEITSHPEGQGIEEVRGERLEVRGERVLMHLGNYDLIIIDGQKYLIRK